jgi:hypothetical protein
MSRLVFYSACVIICLVYGMAAEKYKVFPAPLIHALVDNAKLAVSEIKGDNKTWYDVEVFPRHLPEGVFKHGDIMVSLRNINTVLVFDPQSLKIRYLSAGQFVRQHDADFIDGDHFSVYDNHHVGPPGSDNYSKIVIVSAVDDTISDYLVGTSELPFYSNIMGKHQWLENANLLVAESMNGRAFEVNRDKQPVWGFNNLIALTSTVGIMKGTERLGLAFDAAFLLPLVPLFGLDFLGLIVLDSLFEQMMSLEALLLMGGLSLLAFVKFKRD